jgi:hypothetical protein
MVSNSVRAVVEARDARNFFAHFRANALVRRRKFSRPTRVAEK